MRAPLMTVLLAFTSLPALAQEDASVEQVSSPPAVSRTIGITASGRYLLDGEPISRDALKAAVSAMPPETPLTVRSDPAGPRYATSSVLELLQRAGLTDISMSMSMAAPTPPPTPEPEATSTSTSTPSLESTPAIIGGESWVRPVAEVRFGLHVTQLGPDDGPMAAAFRLFRGAFGAEADLSARLTARVVGNITEARTEESYPVVAEGTETGGTVTVPVSTEGFTIRPRDAWLRASLDRAGRYRLTTGIQPPVFGIHPWLNDQTGGFYTSSPRFQSVAILAGLYEVRAMGARLDADLGQVATISAMVSNADDFLQAEENTGKDTSARLELRPAEPVTVVLSGRYGLTGPENVGTRALVSTAARYDGERFRVMGDVLYGFDEADAADESTRQTLLGLQGAAAAIIPSTIDALESYQLIGRAGFFDPNLALDDATSWMQYNLAGRVAWDTLGASVAQLGLGYEIYIPTSLDEPISHRALAEALWAF
jgi:biopolymer transport protein ExbD